jgi:hypothetical protein
MTQDRLQHDAAWAGAAAVVEIFAPLLRAEEQNEAFGQVYTALRAMLEAYQLQSQREAARLCRPSRN